MFSSCSPTAAFAAGVKIGCSSREPSTSPAGAGQVAARDALDLDHRQPLAEHAPAG
jgi:hypothetical protein